MAEATIRRVPEAGGALLEVVVALAVLATALIPLSAILASATRLSGRAARMRAALHGAAAVAETISDAADYGFGWREVGGPGPDGLPGTIDDLTLAERAGAPCWRRVTPAGADPNWVLIEAVCASAPPGPGATDADSVVVSLMVRR